ncbi:hypothetical protein MFI2_0202 [Mycoplasmopsis fermentans MF-I2]|nr:hypothetical protein MFI2_0202 [Mycoplasmopsis fermentans MF-I2]RMX36127.1 hypothetical protein MFI1_0192 [Mycoplasmopsis fermentans MF-I1]
MKGCTSVGFSAKIQFINKMKGKILHGKTRF